MKPLVKAVVLLLEAEIRQCPASAPQEANQLQRVLAEIQAEEPRAEALELLKQQLEDNLKLHQELQRFYSLVDHWSREARQLHQEIERLKIGHAAALEAKEATIAMLRRSAPSR